MSNTRIGRPTAAEHSPDYQTYIAMVEGDDIISTLENQIAETQKTLAGISEEKSLYRYAAGKWSIREVVGHLIDAERIFAYRALRFARNDRTALVGYEQDDYVRIADFDSRSLRDLAAEFAAVRDANVRMFEGMADEIWPRTGTANETEVSVRALAFIIAGHEIHHMKIVREKYL